MSSLHVLYASTSGHTEYVVKEIAAKLKEISPSVNVTFTRAELATPEDLSKGDVLLLGSGTWNTGSIEGQLNPHMHAFLIDRAAKADLKGKKVLLVALGDARYRYTARAGEHLQKFAESHGGTLMGDRLTIVNEPYGQEEKIHAWTKSISSLLS